MSYIIETRALSKNFGDFAANKSIDLKVRSGRIHAIIGENGAGKSTLMKLLFGLEQPSSGNILLRNQPVQFSNALEAISKGIGMVQQHFALVENASAIENIILGAEPSHFGRIDLDSAIKTIESLLPSESLRVPWLKPVEQLSVGFRQRVEILKVIFRRAEIMIFDEPTGVLTPQESEDLYKIMGDLKKTGKTILLITHKIEDVLKYADDYSVLRRGELVGSGAVSDAKMNDLVQLMVGRTLSLPRIQDSLAGSALLEVKALSTHSRAPIKSLSFSVAAGEILGIAGIEGAGQKSLVDAIMGIENYEGEILIKGTPTTGLSPLEVRALGVANIPEDRLLEGLWAEGSAEKNIVPGRENEFFKNGFLMSAKVKNKASHWFKDFDVRVPHLETPTGRLSGGNQQKLILARELAERKVSLLLCHQPTRGVDIGAIERIHNLLIELRKNGAAILLISSDLDELFSLSDRLLILFEGKLQEQISRSNFSLSRVGEAMTGVRHEV